jgi:asparagine synthase (glutamine-hydrolysing)
MGFPVPLGAWFRGPFRSMIDEYVTGDRTTARGIFNPDFVTKLVAEHHAGMDHSERLWMLLNFEIWQRQFFDGEAMSLPQTSDTEVAVA